jgi:NADP-dependent 3-hydroxy acid dehydrogenase YdfG
MGKLDGKVAWVTGAGSGIGEATAMTLAREGARVVLTGRRKEPLQSVAQRIGGAARVEQGDVTDAARVQAIADAIKAAHGRLDILVSNAGLNVTKRDWPDITPAAANEVIQANLNSAFYCTIAALPLMRAQQDGVLIHTSSMAGRYVSLLSGAAYTAAKHGVVAMSHSINMQECVNGVRSSVVLPGEVATPILDKRPIPVSAEDRAQMVQSEDVADLILYIACLPKHVLLNEVMITPAWNRGYVAALQRRGA